MLHDNVTVYIIVGVCRHSFFVTSTWFNVLCRTCIVAYVNPILDIVMFCLRQYACSGDLIGLKLYTVASLIMNYEVCSLTIMYLTCDNNYRINLLVYEQSFVNTYSLPRFSRHIQWMTSLFRGNTTDGWFPLLLSSMSVRPAVFPAVPPAVTAMINV